jgi:hypothetical protein
MGGGQACQKGVSLFVKVRTHRLSQPHNQLGTARHRNFGPAGGKATGGSGTDRTPTGKTLALAPGAFESAPCPSDETGAAGMLVGEVNAPGTELTPIVCATGGPPAAEAGVITREASAWPMIGASGRVAGGLCRPGDRRRWFLHHAEKTFRTELKASSQQSGDFDASENYLSSTSSR